MNARKVSLTGRLLKISRVPHAVSRGSPSQVATRGAASSAECTAAATAVGGTEDRAAP
jgi:hypothetical protein